MKHLLATKSKSKQTRKKAILSWESTNPDTNRACLHVALAHQDFRELLQAAQSDTYCVNYSTMLLIYTRSPAVNAGNKSIHIPRGIPMSCDGQFIHETSGVLNIVDISFLKLALGKSLGL
jgi:hypothetical protein